MWEYYFYKIRFSLFFSILLLKLAHNEKKKNTYQALNQEHGEKWLNNPLSENSPTNWMNCQDGLK